MSSCKELIERKLSTTAILFITLFLMKSQSTTHPQPHSQVIRYLELSSEQSSLHATQATDISILDHSMEGLLSLILKQIIPIQCFLKEIRRQEQGTWQEMSHGTLSSPSSWLLHLIIVQLDTLIMQTPTVKMMKTYLSVSSQRIKNEKSYQRHILKLY